MLLLAFLPSSVATAQPSRTLRIFPSPVVVAPGEAVEVTAWFCRQPPSGDVFGADGTPGTDDDGCETVKDVSWAVEDQGVARVKPAKGPSVRVTGRRDGLTNLEASYQATSTSSFVSRVPVDVIEPLSATTPDDTDAEAAERPGPGVPAGVVVQPGFAVLAPGDSQVFTAYLCPFLDDSDPRGADQMPGTADDFCRPIEASWRVLGEPPVGTVDPADGYFTVFSADDAEEETGFVSYDTSDDGTGRRTAVTEEGTGQGPSTGAVLAMVLDQEGGASVSIDPDAQPKLPRVPSDVDGDGVVDLDDLRSLGKYAGDPGFEPDADFDGNGAIDLADLSVPLDVVSL